MHDDQDEALDLTARIASATQESDSSHSLKQIYQDICQSGSSSSLDPLQVIPFLLPSPDPAADDIFALLGECGSAKELAIGIQEAMERLQTVLASHDSDDEDTEGRQSRSPNGQLLRLLDLYASSIPRLKFRNKTASEMISPLLSEVRLTFQMAAPSSRRDEGREVINAVSRLLEKVSPWCKSQPKLNDWDSCQAILWNTLDAALIAYAHCIQACLSKRAFVACFPRMAPSISLEPEWEGGAGVVSKALIAYKLLDSPVSLTTGYLILTSHQQLDDNSVHDPNHILSPLFPIILASLQANSYLDEVLALLLLILCRARAKGSTTISSELVMPLATLLPTLATGHPDPNIRHHTFRVLSLLLALSPSILRFQILKELTADNDLPQMRISSVGLVKEAILEALMPNAPKDNVFASSRFLQIFGPIVLRPYPSNFFSASLSMVDLKDSPEPARITECLSLYYTLLLRDTNNKTGVRDLDSIQNVEKTLLSPLRLTIDRWMEDPEVVSGHLNAIMPLVSLRTSLERVDDAIGQV